MQKILKSGKSELISHFFYRIILDFPYNVMSRKKRTYLLCGYIFARVMTYENDNREQRTCFCLIRFRASSCALFSYENYAFYSCNNARYFGYCLL